MGEIADFTNDSQDYWEGCQVDSEPPLRMSCMFCGKGGLHWEGDANNVNYRLCDDIRIIHECSKYKRIKINKNKNRIIYI